MLFAENSDWVLALQVIGYIIGAIFYYKIALLGRVVHDVKKAIDGIATAKQGETDDLRDAALRSMESGLPVPAGTVIAASEKKAGEVAKVNAGIAPSVVIPTEPPLPHN